MKKSICLLVVVFMFVVSLLAVSASGDADATLKVDYSVNESNGNINMNASFVDIKPENGLISIEYKIEFDKSALELVSVTTEYPDSWKPLLDSEMVEDLSSKNEGFYHWAIIVIAQGEGLKNGDNLKLNLEFKPLKNGNTDVNFKFIDLGTEILKNGMTEALLRVSGNSVAVSINLDDPKNPEIDDTSITTPDVSYVPGIDVSGDFEGNESYSGGTLVSLPSINEQETSVAEPANDGAGNSWILWCVIGVGVVGIAAVVTVVCKSKKGK